MLNEKEIQKNRKILSETDKNMVMAFKVLGDINRFRIFRILSQQPKISISSLAKILKISLPLASQHVKILEQAELLQKERGGKKIYPKLEYGNPFVQTVVKTIQEVLKFTNKN